MAKDEKAHQASFGPLFTSKLLAVVTEAGPYRAEVGGAMLEVLPRSDSTKAGCKLPARHCNWNDGWDIRTLVVFEGEEMSFKALKQKMSSDIYKEAQCKMAQLKESIKSVAKQAVEGAKADAVQAISQDMSGS